ncbi:Geminin [Orchesella cincta]|uniref:Geminin n=1 Tax=Orchesella cincta TaxID=48709 RepID=A0A1D2N5E9_ORCCI|nr:Geminin [Orchesella cincta]
MLAYAKNGRRPLTEVQKAGSTSRNEMVGRQQTSIKKLGAKTPDSPKETKNALSKVKSGLVSKKKPAKIFELKDTQTQTDNGDDSIVTGEEAPLEYWKELAETRRQALEEALEENCGLHKRVEELEHEKTLLEEMVEQAKHLASMLENLSDDENPDESGIDFGPANRVKIRFWKRTALNEPFCSSNLYIGILPER